MILLISLSSAVSFAQMPAPIYIVDHPTAGLLENGEYHIYGRIGPESSMLFGLRVGFKGVFQVGASFGMQRLFERGDVDVNDRVGFQFRIRLLEEYMAPALAVGFDSQGRGFYHEDRERYDRKSPGFYLVLSKNYRVALGDLSLHGGANYSLENKDDDDPDLFVAAEWSPIMNFSLLMDADAALNDNVEGSPFGKGGIYLDGAIRFNYRDNLSFMLIFRDLTGNFRGASGVGRELEISFWDAF